MSQANLKINSIHRSYNDVMVYLESNSRTLQEEFELIQQKKSLLSRRLRDFVEFMIEVEKHSPESTLEDSILKTAAHEETK